MAYNAVGYLNQQQQVVGGLNATGGLSATLNNAVVSQSSIAQYPTIADFPEYGSSKILYIDQSTMRAYVWYEDNYSSISGNNGIESISVDGVELIPVDNNVNIPLGDDLQADAQGVINIIKANAVEQDNTRPITAAAVYTEVGNINALLATI